MVEPVSGYGCARRYARACVGVAVVFFVTLLTGPATAHAQDIEPRAYSNAPIGVNFFIAGYAYTNGGLSFDPALEVTNPQLETHNAVFAYARVFGIGGKSGKFDVILPYTWLSGTAERAGELLEREVDGFSDVRLRVSVNLYGAPAMQLKDFAQYEQDLIVGVSLQVSAPTGQYDNTRVVNISTHRWSFKPEVGVSKAFGRWTTEGAIAAFLYTDNDDFYGGQTRSQDPIYSLQGHFVYSFQRGKWAALDVNYFTGGRTTIEGTLNNDLQQNWRIGGTFALPVDRLNSIKFYASSGVSARTGNNFDLLGVAWQHRWGGGL